MLLEHQNLKRLMLERQAQDQLAHPNKAAYDSLEKSRSRSARASSMQRRTGRSSLTTMPPIGGKTNFNQDYGDGLMTSATTSAQGPDDASKHELNNQNPALAMALHVISRTLNLQDESDLTAGNLQSFALALQEKKDHARTYNPWMQMIHRVSTNDGKKTATGQKMYLDMPQWVEGASSSRDALVGNLVIQDIPAYLSEHPDICFLVYRLRQYWYPRR